MIKKILFIATIISVGFVSAQNLELKDESDNSIDGLTHYIYDTGINMANTKFHVANSSANVINFDCSVWELGNPTLSEWQVCFGINCYIANDGDPNEQTYASAPAPAMGSYNDLKIAPFSFGWSNGDWGVWRVRVFDGANSGDSSTCYIVWTMGGTFSGDQNGNNIVDGSEIAGDMNANGTIDGGEITGDMNGNGVIDVWEVLGDANGNGIIDNGEVTSVVEFNEDNVMFNTYPNPVLNNLTVSYALEGNADNARVDVYDVLGQKINTYTLSNNKGQLNVNVESLNSGVYFYTIKVNEKTIRTERVIIK